MTAAESWRLAFRQRGTNNTLVMARGSTHWNDFLQAYLMIAQPDIMHSGAAGEIYAAKAPNPQGPWTDAVLVAQHNSTGSMLGNSAGGTYTAAASNLYNPTQHAFLDRHGGEIVYFSGTFSTSFSSQETATPRYDYNSLMYRLNLSDVAL